VRRRFEEAGAQQKGALDSFIQKREEDVSSGNGKAVDEKEDFEMDIDIADACW